jgi:hypothetical protein
MSPASPLTTLPRFVAVACGLFLAGLVVLPWRGDESAELASTILTAMKADTSLRQNHGIILAVVLEPGICFGCSHLPAALDSVRNWAPNGVAYFWRRTPSARELTASAPLRLKMTGTLNIPWPLQVPNGPRYALLRGGRLMAADSTGRLADLSLVLAQATRLARKARIGSGTHQTPE